MKGHGFGYIILACSFSHDTLIMHLAGSLTEKSLYQRKIFSLVIKNIYTHMHTTLREVSAINILTVQLLSVAPSCLTLCDPMYCSRPGKKISLVFSFYSALCSSLALVFLLFIFEYWSSLEDRLTKTCCLKNHWPICYCPCLEANSGRDGWRWVLEESAPVREGR